MNRLLISLKFEINIDNSLLKIFDLFVFHNLCKKNRSYELIKR